MNIVITGFMGTGKSAVGKALAGRLRWQFFDTDAIIEQEVGATVAEIFAQKGETYFRKIEAKTAALLGLLDEAVISCGGGIVLDSCNLDELERNGYIVCLTARPDVILARVQGNSDRPLLKTKNPLEKIQTLLAERAPCYRRCHATIDTSDLDVNAIVEKIVEELRSLGKL